MNEARWEKLKSFVAERTLQPLGPDDGYSELEIAEAEAQLEIRFPEALREYYQLVGKRYFGDQNYLYGPDQFVINKENSCLYFWEENQSVFYFGISLADLADPDPIVTWISDDHSVMDSDEEPTRFSEIGLLIIAMELVNGGQFMAIGYSSFDHISSIQRTAVPSIYPVLARMSFFEVGKLLVQFTGVSMNISAPNEAILNLALESFEDMDWNYISTEEEDM